MTVLLTLDEGRLRQILQKHLQDRCVVLAASNRHHARELLARGGVDVVIAGIGSGSRQDSSFGVMIVNSPGSGAEPRLRRCSHARI